MSSAREALGPAAEPGVHALNFSKLKQVAQTAGADRKLKIDPFSAEHWR